MLSSRCLLRSHLRVLSKTSTSPFLPNHFTAAFATTSYTMAQEYKLKGLTSIDLKPGEKREYEIEGIEEGKVLLCNVGGKTTAIGSKCTHYGAPLVKGVLTGDGRLTCPWHGGEISTQLHTAVLSLTRSLQPASMPVLVTSKMLLLLMPSQPSSCPRRMVPYM